MTITPGQSLTSDYGPHGLPEPSEPSPGEGYRWVKKGETIKRGDQDYYGSGGWRDIVAILGEECDEPSTYRRRIEPQAEVVASYAGVTGPTQATMPTPRAFREIAKEAARALLDNTEGVLYSAVDKDDRAITRSACVSFIESYEYARSIGAIE